MRLVAMIAFECGGEGEIQCGSEDVSCLGQEDRLYSPRMSGGLSTRLAINRV